MTDRATIVARATSPGPGALALIRLSGPGVREVLKTLGVGEPEPRRAVLAPIRSVDGRLLDRGIVTFFAAPGSYTGEDVAELSVHGGPAVVHAVLDACRQAGARDAEPGEFTKRAWLEGKLDRLQVEAVRDLVEAESPARHAVAIHQAEGGLSRRIVALRREVIEVEALLAHHLDFPDEDEPPTPTEALIKRLHALAAAMGRLLATAPEGRLLNEGAAVALAGRPNAGKSSLFNALVGSERVLVDAEAGTTRDAVEAGVIIGGFPFRLVDTAGIRDALAGAEVATAGAVGAVEAAGIEIAKRWVAGAGVVLWCRRADEGPPDGPELRAMTEVVGIDGPEPRPILPVMSCADLSGARSGDGPSWPPVASEGWIAVSSRTGEGLDRLRDRLVSLAFGGLAGGGIVEDEVLVHEHHRRALARARDDVVRAAELLAKGVDAEFAATHLRDAEEALASLIGPVDTEEVLDAVFRSFCIGK